MQKIFSLIIISLLISSCSKPAGKTNAKLNIITGNFQALLSSKANNGLIFYGKSSDGKSFTKKIDSDTVDLVFPNGTWNFYAISWEASTPPAIPDFTGKNYCGKASAVFDGTDATVTMNITNTGCNDPEFSNDVKLNSGVYQLPKISFLTCKDVVNIDPTSLASCDKTPVGKFNKGYATAYRIAAYEAKNFGVASAPVKIAQSACIKSNPSLLGTLESTEASKLANIRIPTISGNGLRLGIEVYYSALGNCDSSEIPDTLSLTDNPRVRIGVDNSGSTLAIYNLFVKSSSDDVCLSPRLNASAFSGGFGSIGSPYAICMKDQLNLLRGTSFSSYKNSSFDLLTDIDYLGANGLATIAPIGDALATTGGSATNAYGGATTSAVFDGRDHTISNFIIDCKLPGAAMIANNQVGFFRLIKNAMIRNLTFNNAVVMCDGGDEVGVLSGALLSSSTDISVFENIRIHGHADGKTKIGGLIGSIVGSTGQSLVFNQIHVKGDYGGHQYVGGLIGSISMSISSSMTRSSFSGELHADYQDAANAPTLSYVGGLVGRSLFTGSGSLTIDRAIVKSKLIKGSTTVGGFIGESQNTSIQDSYTEAVLQANGKTDGSTYFTNVGGAIGKATGGTLLRTFVFNSIKSSNRASSTDHTYGGLVGANGGTAATCANSFFTGDYDVSGTGCGSLISLVNSKSQSVYAGVISFSAPQLVDYWDPMTDPGFSPTCTTPDKGKYYKASSSNISLGVYVGDVLLCNGTSNTVVHVDDQDNVFTSSPYAWRMPDNGDDIPRLAFEEVIEDRVPYLKRECHGHFTLANQYGTGTVADPKWICSLDQFDNLRTSHSGFFILKNNIAFEQSGAPFTPFPSGIYKINGNGKAILGPSLLVNSSINSSASFGLFSSLTNGSEIAHFDLIGPRLNLSAPISGSSQVHFGLLAGDNEGVIADVKVLMGNAALSLTTTSGTNVTYGAVVGFNKSLGVLSKIRTEAFSETFNTSVVSGSTYYAGGVVGKNSGLIDGVRASSVFSRTFGCSAASLPLYLSNQEYLGGFVGQNSGTVREVDTDGGVIAGISSGSSYSTCIIKPSGNISTFVADNNSGLVQDFKVRAFSLFMNSSNKLLELFANNTGTVQRGFVTIGYVDANIPLPQAYATAAGNWDAVAVNNFNPTCDSTTAGIYYNVSSSYASTNFGAVTIGDMIICDGLVNRLVPGSLKNGILAPKDDVFYLVENSLTPPTLLPGRVFENQYEFSKSSVGGLSMELLPSTSISLASSGWSVSDNFFNPGASVWFIDDKPGVTVSTSLPSLVKTSGSLEQLGSPF